MWIRINKFIVALFFFTVITSKTSLPQQIGDSSFNPIISNPAFAQGTGPAVFIDEAHNNFHTVDGRYQAFADLLRRDGYVVKGFTATFTQESLKAIEILVIANPVADINVGVENWTLPTPSAFLNEEINAVTSWIQTGGALLLIADHMPWPGATEKLASKLGFIFGNGYAIKSDFSTKLMQFRISDGSLRNHPIINGRDTSEIVKFVTTFTGQAFRIKNGISAHPLMILDDAVLFLPLKAPLKEFTNSIPNINASGMLQGAVRRFGKGRVAVFGEAAMFTAQVSGHERSPMGMNHPNAPHNAQFVLNLMHWLSGLLPDK